MFYWPLLLATAGGHSKREADDVFFKTNNVQHAA